MLWFVHQYKGSAAKKFITKQKRQKQENGTANYNRPVHSSDPDVP